MDQTNIWFTLNTNELQKQRQGFRLILISDLNDQEFESLVSQVSMIGVNFQVPRKILHAEHWIAKHTRRFKL